MKQINVPLLLVRASLEVLVLLVHPDTKSITHCVF